MRLIDADAPSKDLEKRWDVSDDQDFCNKEVWHALEEAPTIEPSGDLISRQAAIEAVQKRIEKSEVGESVDHDAVIADLESLPSAETPTISEKNQLSEETPTNTPTDLISRRKAIKAVESKLYVYENKHLNDYEQGWNDACEYIEDDILEQLPSAPDSRQRGEWVPVMDKWGAHFVCSQCGAWRYHIDQDFCGLCGADMRRGGEDE